MRFTPGEPIVWRVSLTSSAEQVFSLLDTDEGRERHWARRSRSTPDGFDLEFAGGLTEHVTVLERVRPVHLRIRYFGSETDLVLEPLDDGGCVLEVTCRCDDVAEWMEFFPGWVSWLLVLKAAADYGDDLRSGSPERGWSERYVDP
jgi:hypothetical protein